MKTQTIYRSTLLGALLLTATAHAQNAAPPQLPAVVADADAAKRAVDNLTNSELFQGFTAASNELTPLLINDNPASKLVQIKKFDFSTETKKKLLPLYGSDHPLHFKTRIFKDGQAEISYVLDALNHRDPKSRVTTQISALTGKSVYRKHNTQYGGTASLPSIHVDVENEVQFYAHDITYTENQTRKDPGLWFGRAEFKLGHLSVDVVKKDIHLKVDDTVIKTDVKKRGTLVDVEVDSVTQSINWGGDQLGPVHSAYRFSNIDGKALASFGESQKRIAQSKMPADATAATTLRMFRTLGIATLKSGGALDIQDVSVQYHGMTAGLDGRVGFDHVQDADWDAPMSLLPKLNLHINFHAPKDLLMEISRRVVRSKLAAEAAPGSTVSDPMVEDAALEVTNKLLELPLKLKWLRLEHGTLLSTLDFIGGNLTVNGEPFRPPTANR